MIEEIQLATAQDIRLRHGYVFKISRHPENHLPAREFIERMKVKEKFWNGLLQMKATSEGDKVPTVEETDHIRKRAYSDFATALTDEDLTETLAAKVADTHEAQIYREVAGTPSFISEPSG